MNYSNLQNLLNEYEEKRNKSISLSNLKKENLYNQVSSLKDIDININKASVDKIRLILTTKNQNDIYIIDKHINELKKERDRILTDRNINLDDYKPVFECSKCNDTGYITVNGKSELCSCIKQKLYNIEYNNSNIYDLENQNFSKFDLNYYSNDIDEEKFERNISPRDNIINIKKICDNFIENFDNPIEKNLLFCGSPGLGKTFLSSCIANELIQLGKTVLYQTAPIMLDQIIDAKFNKKTSNLLNEINNVDLLIIDDLGTESKNSVTTTELFNIINSRLLNQNNKITKTIISTNYDLKQLYNIYEERLLSRIIGNYNACYFFGDDIRIIKKISSK